MTDIFDYHQRKIAASISREIGAYLVWGKSIKGFWFLAINSKALITHEVTLKFRTKKELLLWKATNIDKGCKQFTSHKS